MKNLFYQQDLISIQDLSIEQINQVLAATKRAKYTPLSSQLLKDKIIAHCFFEPSTRTRLSFEAATQRLGGSVIGFSSDENLSIKKGETLHDTIRIIADYSDLIIMRHEKEGAARMAANLSDKPVVNAGDGANQHPTQALTDLFTIYESQKRVDGLSIALVGDLKYGRTIHSFMQICMQFDIRLFLVAPELLTLPESFCDELKKKGIRFSFHDSLQEVIPKADVLYMIRIQKERLTAAEHMQFEKQFSLTVPMLHQAKSNLSILHPLPRVNEIDPAVDKTAYAQYFNQAKNGVFVRQVLLSQLLLEPLL